MKRTERGYAMLVFVFCLLTFGLMLPYGFLAQLARRHDEQVLRAAKSAALAWAVSRYPGRDREHDRERGQKRDVRVGELVMPDKTPPGEDGRGSGTQSATAGKGRLPWKTLGLPPLYDADGELLWYSVNSPFRDSGRGESVLSCDSQGNIRIYGQHHPSEVWSKGIAAAVIAPHLALGGQRRHTTMQQIDKEQYAETGPFPLRLRDGKEKRWLFVQGPIRQDGQLVANDRVLGIECALLERAKARRKRREDA